MYWFILSILKHALNIRILSPGTTADIDEMRTFKNHRQTLHIQLISFKNRYLKEILDSKIHYCPVRKSNRLIDLKSA